MSPTTHYQLMLEEFKNLGSPKQLATFIVENLPDDYTSRKLFIHRAALYCDLEYMTFRLIYKGERKKIAFHNYRKLVMGWLRLNIDALSS